MLVIAEIALGFWEIVIEDGSSILVYAGVSNGLLAAFFVALYFTRRPLKRRYVAVQKEQEKAGRSLPLHTSEFRSKLTLPGLPLIFVVRSREFGTDAERSTAVKAWIAMASPLNPIPAYGLIFAFGRRAFAPVSVGMLAVGLVPIGACSVGLLAVGGFVVGGWAVGIVALGRMADGILSAGWIGAAGIWAFARDFAEGDAAFATHVDDNLANTFFDRSRFFSAVHAGAEFRHLFMLMAVLASLWWDRRARQLRNKAAALLGAQSDPRSVD